MLFSSPAFLFLFLPITIAVYYLATNKLKNLVLLIFSLGFYAVGEGSFVILILISAFIDFSCGLIIEKINKKTGLVISLVFNLGLLLYFKYFYFIADNISSILHFFNYDTYKNLKTSNIVLPLGISFFTFQTMSYTIDVYRGKIKASRNFIDFTTYVALFPQLIAGPIVRYKEIKDELISRKTNFTQFSEGIERFILGLSKKIIIANNCAFLADGMFSLSPDDLSMSMAWLGILAYSFQIYFDFSGYSDMAIGLGKMFGFNFPENFNYPYISKSIREFWRRWHITLSNWFKDYVYISLGGNRNGKLRTYFNLFFVFFVTGLWHGASWTFVLWGVFHGVFLMIERMGFQKVLDKLPKAFSHIYTLLVVILAWVLFRCDTIGEATNYYRALFNFNRQVNFEYLNFHLTKEITVVLFLALIFSTPIIKRIFPSNRLSFNYSYILKTIFLLVLFIINYFYIATGSYNPFIYFRF